MAHWYSVYHDEDYEADIQVGLYDQWLQQLGSGTTQAERVLIHTPVMELADERRFAVCQAGIDMSFFEADHSRRIEATLDHVQLRIETHASTEICEAEDYHDEGLIGLVKHPTQHKRIDCSQFLLCPDVPSATLVQKELSSMLGEAQQRTTKRPRTPCVAISADSSDDEDYLDFQARLYDIIVTTRKKAKTMSSAGALQLKAVRFRRDPYLIQKDSGKQKHCAGLYASHPA